MGLPRISLRAESDVCVGEVQELEYVHKQRLSLFRSRITHTQNERERERERLINCIAVAARAACSPSSVFSQIPTLLAYGNASTLYGDVAQFLLTRGEYGYPFAKSMPYFPGTFY